MPVIPIIWTAFSRCRKLPLPALVAVMLTGMHMSIQSELDTFFAHLAQQAQLMHKVSEQAFAKANLVQLGRASNTINALTRNVHQTPKSR